MRIVVICSFDFSIYERFDFGFSLSGCRVSYKASVFEFDRVQSRSIFESTFFQHHFSTLKYDLNAHVTTHTISVKTGMIPIVAFSVSHEPMALNRSGPFPQHRPSRTLIG